MQKEKKVKLLIITQAIDTNNPILGFFCRWVEEFAKHCESITVICLFEGEHNLPANVKVLSLGKELNADLRGPARGLTQIKYLTRFYKYIWNERKNYDVVFVHMNPIYVVLGGVLWRMWKKKISLWYTHKSVDLKLRVAEKFVHIIFTASKESFRLPSKKVFIMGHGIDCDQFKPNAYRDNSILHIITVGRITPIKNYETLIEALAIVARNSIPFTLEIIGVSVTKEDEAYNINTHTLIQEKNLTSRVVFTGKVSHDKLPEHLNKADIFVNLSETGSLDKAILEAMACGLMVVTSNEACKEMFGGDKEILTFPQRDAQALADRLKKLSVLGDDTRHALTKRLRHVIVEEHNIKILIPRILSHYEASQ
ncbi:MAG: hypothetical protein A2919_00190 [Candidatus Spechtbacteria bacterium RIFCSPLOWO2_01_FULL_43_12]|uniref:Glycosyl transferase family 1 domain-containing protein n=1 Tax=Candidatus Spechtbacteria bacterium RIFCSPLOWO2_01_FULL_43_12 TaxID=1802162 RepID=A0A1G2HE18_9BACT|nr:MAG: hypothetical protein A2919_00190 [Candidatus Spechtbacteria bacterium RIFCSPLOWO2_01_FULL_43_12]